MTTDKPTNKPVHKLRLGRVTAAIWEREDRTERLHYSVSLTRSYKTEDGFRDTSNLDMEDLPLAQKLLSLAQDWILSQPLS